MRDDFIQNPYPTYAMLAEKNDASWNQTYRSWCVYGYQAAIDAMSESTFSSQVSGFLLDTTFPTRSRPQVEPLISFLKQWMFYLDSPNHTLLRSKVSPAFSRKAIMTQEANIQSIIESTCRPLGAEFDFVNTVASKISPQVIANIMGLPKKDAPTLLRWTYAIADFLDAFVRTKALSSDALTAMRKMEQYFKHDWILNAMLITTGIETSVSLLSNLVYLLLKHPDQLTLLKNNPNLIDQAIDEALRFEPPVHLNVRCAKENLHFYGCDIKAGDMISIVLASANRDSRVIEDPNTFDITKKRKRHLSFGHGIHYCLGRELARLTAQQLLTYLLENWPAVQLTDPHVTWKMGTSIRRLKALKLLIPD